LSEQVIVSLDAKARDAASNASTALNNSRDAEAKSKEAIGKAGESLDKSNAANEAAGEAQHKVGVVSARAEEIDTDLARTQYLLSGRSITNFNSLVAQLKQYPHRVPHIGSTSDIEQDLLCAALYKAAHDAGMNPVDECGRLARVGQMPTGVAISGPNQQETLNIAQILSHTCDLGVGGIQSGTFSPELEIFVWARPPFMVTQARGVKAPTKKQANKHSAPP
jgi:hypothetical protein